MILINELKRQRPNKNYLFQWHKKKHKNFPRKFNKIVPLNLDQNIQKECNNLN